MAGVGRALVGLVMGYILGAAAGALLLAAFSGNTHDKSLEIAMTGAFVTGPIGALVGAVAGWLWRRGDSRSQR